MECDQQPEKLQWTEPVAGNDNNYHESSIRPYQRGKYNTIRTSQLSTMISYRTDNQWHMIYTYNSSYLEETWRIPKITKAIGRVSEWRQ